MMKYRKIYYALSAALVIASLLALAVFRIPLGIDFNGGSLLEIEFTENQQGEVNVMTRQQVETALEEIEQIGQLQIQETDANTLILRFSTVDENTHQQILSALRESGDFTFQENRFESIGPTIGAETKQKSYIAISLVLVMIVAYVAWAFRKISYPVSSFRYGLVALAALFHDVIITLGVFALWAHISGTEAGVPFVAAVLTILGYSVNDTIVVFDRVRENIIKTGDTVAFEDTVSKSVRQSIVRSVNTSLTTLFVLFAILFWGGASINNFVSTMIIGIAIGTYSSLFFASPILVSWANKMRS